jgi:PBP1b-binding outer membrane lipoprotein LpoB
MKKIGMGIITMLLILLAVMASGCTSSDNSTNTSKNTAPPINSTINGLYKNAPALGTNVQVTGTVLQSASDFIIIRNSDLQTVYVSLDFSNNKTAYEDQSVTVIGSFSGPTQYTTVSGAPKSIPGIDHAKIV